jgi:hypothetical protein
MGFNQPKYIEEMTQLVRRAIEAWKSRSDRPLIYTISIWTDAGAQTSAVAIDTRSRSEAFVAEMRDFARKERDHLLKEGDLELAELFARDLRRRGRSRSPADFEFPMFESLRHKSFDSRWGNSEKCWRSLEPALLRVRDISVPLFRELPLEPDAELAVNSGSDWYDHAVRIGVGARPAKTRRS